MKFDELKKEIGSDKFYNHVVHRKVSFTDRPSKEYVLKKFLKDNHGKAYELSFQKIMKGLQKHESVLEIPENEDLNED